VTDEIDRVEDAGRLLAFGLRPRLRPAAEPAYRALLSRYRSDGAFRVTVDTCARGLGLLVLGGSDHGLVLGAEDDGAFAQRLVDYRRQSMSVEERMAHGFIQLAIAAWCFPTAQHLDERDSVVTARMSVGRLVQYIVSLCEELKSRGDQDEYPTAAELAPAWMALLARAETRTTRDGRRAPGTLAGMVAHALEHLEAGGLVRQVSDEDSGTWQALGGYRLQVRELAALDAFSLVRELGERRP
jgi:hypothetical protein